MIQLKVYPNTNKVQSQQIFLDLYDTEPIKLNLSIEDITNADATSVFSRTFKIPATRHNNEFFKTVFEVDGVDYDVTVKKPAEILVDGAEFRQGHIRLQKIYINDDLDKTDYELLFLGETRDFSTVIGDKPLCQLVMPDLQATDGSGNPRNPTVSDVETSWQAYPQLAQVDGDGNPNAGLSNGNLLFPLIDHGNNYDQEGAVESVTMQIGSTNAEKSFVTSQFPLPISRLKPMIRAKRIWDQIFEDAGYTYTSDFITSPKFHQMYVSAFGNVANIGYTASGSGENLLNAEYNGTANQYFYDYLHLPDNVYDPGGNYTIGNVGTSGSKYVCPADAVAGDTNAKYRIVAEAYVFGEREVSCPGFCTDPVTARLQLYNVTTGQVLKSSGWGYDQVVGFTFDTETDGVGVNAGDVLKLRVTPYVSTDFDEVRDIKWQVLQAPGTLLPSSDLDCEYKQIDFIKDVLKMFRLVMAPDRNDTKNFIIEPWQTYINSGDLHDWSHKLVKNKDVVLEPLFNTQSDEIEFRFQEDEDYVNFYHQEAYKEPYGYLEFDSNNELLKGTRKIETIEIAPTPLVTIQENAVNTNHQAPGWIFPQIHTHEAEDGITQHLPIKPRTRFLFYNGLQPIPNGLEWYLSTSSNSYTNYPLVSPYENWPQTQDGLNLNWYNDIKYWEQVPSTQVFNTDGQTLYDQYWSRYINSLYNKYSRRMTAYFVLNNVDLQDLSFDDTIFVNGKYWRPEKIIDAQIGERTEVKVQLISANDYKPAVYIDEQLTNFSALPSGTLCGCDGQITINTNGASPFTWQLNNGQTGQAVTTGPNPQIFTIDDLCAGTYTVTVYDDLGRYNSDTVTVPDTSAPEITATHVVVDDPNCYSSSGCAGEVTVTPAGGSGSGYTVYWTDGPTGATRTGLCGGVTYTYYIEDSYGCQSDNFDVTVPCADPETRHLLRRDFGCQALSSDTFIASAPVSYAIGTYVNLQELEGCYVVMNYTTDPAQYTITNTFPTCTDCQTVTPPQKWELRTCANELTPVPELTVYLDGADYPNLTIGQSVTIQGSYYCWEVIRLVNNNDPAEVVTEVFQDCQDCQDAQLNLYEIVNCNGFSPTAVANTGIFTPQTTEPDPSGVVIKTSQPTYDVNGWWHDGAEPCYPNNGFYVPANTPITITWSGTATLQNPQPIGSIMPAPPQIYATNYDSATCNLTGISNKYQPDAGYLWPTVYTTQPFQYRLSYTVPAQTFTIAQIVPVLVNASPADELSVTWGESLFNMNDGVTGNVMSSSSTLNIGDIVTVNEEEGCFEVIATVDPSEVADYSYNQDNGIYEDCETCTGGDTQHCHTVTAGPSGAEISWYYDDGTGVAAYSQGLASGQVVTICAQLNSIQVILNTATIVDLGTECSKFVDPVTGTVGTTCDTPTTPTKYCYTITATNGQNTFTAFAWFEDNVYYSNRLLAGDSQNICADQNTVQVTTGTGTITGGLTTCTSKADCGICYTYTYRGPQKTDLLYLDCDGTQQYIRDVYSATLNTPAGVIDDCIAELISGTAIPFLTQDSTCT